jgi:magnesium transporter
MFYSFENYAADPVQFEDVLSPRGQYWGILGFTDLEGIRERLGLSERVFAETLGGKSNAFENHDGFDYLYLNILNHKTLLNSQERICVYVRKNLILFICRDADFDGKFLNEWLFENGRCISFDRMLSTFLERITQDDADFLEKMETEISGLENALITSKKRTCVKEIVSLRKRLMVLKRYYEQLLNVLDELQENENEIMSSRSMRYFKIFSGKVDRLYHSVLNLRDYVTQVREAYQAEVDISLNYVMKVFTVITAIFLPLTLIAGWYGMNLKMPEVKWDFGYPMVILLSIAVVVFCLVFFKRKKWF